jgi:methionine aminopeptidase
MAENHVLVVRHPDGPNVVTTDGDVGIIDIDLGADFDGKPGDFASAYEFALSVSRLDDVPVSSPVFNDAVETFYDVLSDWGSVQSIIDEYVAARRREHLA